MKCLTADSGEIRSEIKKISRSNGCIRSKKHRSRKLVNTIQKTWAKVWTGKLESGLKTKFKF